MDQIHDLVTYQTTSHEEEWLATQLSVLNQQVPPTYQQHQTYDLPFCTFSQAFTVHKDPGKTSTPRALTFFPRGISAYEQGEQDRHAPLLHFSRRMALCFCAFSYSFLFRSFRYCLCYRALAFSGSDFTSHVVFFFPLIWSLCQVMGWDGTCTIGDFISAS